ncbi:MAG: hypothetical protein Q8O42_13795 [Acidobacteriota bacterium]|nr:hypothetical protein [Acidobacteriota bacterium]
MLSTDTTTAMQDALQAAVKNINGAVAHEPKAPPVDTMSLLMTVVPKLLQGSASSGEMVEKLDALQKGDLQTMREQVLLLRKQCHRLLKSQEQVLARVDEIQQQQLAVGRAVLDLARQLGRITFIEDADEIDEDADPEGGADERYRRDGRGAGDGQRRGARESAAQYGLKGRPGR